MICPKKRLPTSSGKKQKNRCFGRLHRRNRDASPQFVGALLRDAVASARPARGAGAAGRACDAPGGALLYGAAQMG